MSRVRINFLGPLQLTEGQLLDTICDACPVSIRDLFIGTGHCIVALNELNDVDLFSSEEVQAKLLASNLKVANNRSNAQHERTLFVTKLRPLIEEYDLEFLTNKINLQNGVKIQRLHFAKKKDYRPGQSISLKITFETKDDADKILTTGIQIHRFDIKAKDIFREDPIEIVQCFKCFEFGHHTRHCSSDSTYCSQCAGKHNFRDCTSSYRKCKLCDNNDHLAVARDCPVRKDYIRHLLDEKREQRKTNPGSLPSPSPPPPPPPPSAPSSSHSSPNPPPPPPSQPPPSTSSHIPPLFNGYHSAFPSLPSNPPPPQNNVSQIPLPPPPPPSSSPPPPPSHDPSHVINNSFIHHSWEVQTTVMCKYAELYSQGDPFLFLSTMNQFLDLKGVPRVPVLTSKPQQQSTHTNTSPIKPVLQQTQAQQTSLPPSPVQCHSHAQQTSPPPPPPPRTYTSFASISFSPLRTSSPPPRSPRSLKLPPLSPIPGTPTQAISFHELNLPTHHFTPTIHSTPTYEDQMNVPPDAQPDTHTDSSHFQPDSHPETDSDAEVQILDSEDEQMSTTPPHVTSSPSSSSSSPHSPHTSPPDESDPSASVDPHSPPPPSASPPPPPPPEVENDRSPYLTRQRTHLLPTPTPFYVTPRR